MVKNQSEKARQAFLKAQIDRFSVLRGWKNLEAAGRAELGNTLGAVAENEDHARRIVSEIVQDAESRFCPRPSEIRTTAKFVPAVVQEQGIGCFVCRKFGGAGLIYVHPETRVEYNHIPASDEPAAMALCQCRKGAAA